LDPYISRQQTGSEEKEKMLSELVGYSPIRKELPDLLPLVGDFGRGIRQKVYDEET
jgi:hypothetical protein